MGINLVVSAIASSFCIKTKQSQLMGFILFAMLLTTAGKCMFSLRCVYLSASVKVLRGTPRWRGSTWPTREPHTLHTYAGPLVWIPPTLHLCVFLGESLSGLLNSQCMVIFSPGFTRPRGRGLLDLHLLLFTGIFDDENKRTNHSSLLLFYKRAGL